MTTDCREWFHYQFYYNRASSLLSSHCRWPETSSSSIPAVPTATGLSTHISQIYTQGSINHLMKFLFNQPIAVHDLLDVNDTFFFSLSRRAVFIRWIYIFYLFFFLFWANEPPYVSFKNALTIFSLFSLSNSRLSVCRRRKDIYLSSCD